MYPLLKSSLFLKVLGKVIRSHIFLFILAMEGIMVAMKSAGQQWLFQGVPIPNKGTVLSRFFYADDALFQGKVVDV